MSKCLFAAVLLLLVTSCKTVPRDGYVELKGWPVPTGKVAGYNIYMAEKSGGDFEKITLQPINGLKVKVDHLEPNKKYYFRMTQVSFDDPPRESQPSKVWQVQAIKIPTTIKE